MNKKGRTLKTGTTICGIRCSDGVVLAADTRATSGSIVSDKNCLKLHRITDNIYCAGAGTVADIEHTLDTLAAQLKLLFLNTKSKPRVSSAICYLSQLLHKYQGHLGCALIIGGIDTAGSHLFNVFPHGSCDSLPFAAMGSGSLCAMGELELGYYDNITVEAAIKLCATAISSGIMNDLGSGGNVDIAVMTNTETKIIRNYFNNMYVEKESLEKIPKGTTPILKELFL